MKIKTVILTADKPTVNGTIYKREALENAVNIFHKFGSVLACSDSFTDVMFSDLERSSHCVTGLELIGDELVATLEVLDTPMGHILKEQIASVGEDRVCTRSIGVGVMTQDPTGQHKGVIEKNYQVTSVVFVPN